MSNTEARQFCDDPREFFGTNRKMFATPFEEIRKLQLAALQHRFETLKGKVKLFDKLAKRNNVEGVETLEDGAKLLYPSNVYKSYPFSWLEDGDYKRLSNWLQQLTSHDLSKLDLDGVVTIDEWFERVEEQTRLSLCHSSSTTGKLSFVPRGVDEWIRRSKAVPFAYETAGNEEGEESVSLTGLPSISTFYRSGHSAALKNSEWMERVHYNPDGKHPERILTLYPGKMSSEIMVLAGRLRSGQVSGDPRSMQLPQRLLDKREALNALLSGTTGNRLAEFLTEARDRFGGQHVAVGGVWPSLVDAAVAAHDLGMRDVFDPTSLMMSGGGSKGRNNLPDNARDLVFEWTGVNRMVDGYGMSELMGANTKCAYGHFHINPWLIPYVLDVDTLEALPSEGVQIGRLAGIDLTASSFWSGFISTDLVTIHWDSDCECGRQGPYLDSNIRRVENVEDDKISCSATPGAHDETIEFLIAQGA